MPNAVRSSEPLTKNQALVLGALSAASGPLSAYTILDQLRDYGVRAPQQVYRALDKLVACELVHRLESLNAFVACRHAGGGGHDVTAFMICENCDHVIETTDTALADCVREMARDADFSLTKTTIETRGRCEACAKT